MKGGRIPELDGVRGIAILMVLIWHYFPCQTSVIEPGSLLSYAYVATAQCFRGVDLFFVLSGYLIGGILYEHRASTNLFRVFYTRRASRILPAYAVLISTFFIAKALDSNGRLLPALQGSIPLWSYFTFTQNVFMGLQGTFGSKFLAVTWSLAVEEQFYLLAPAIVLVLKSRRHGTAIALLVVASVLLRFRFPGFHTFMNTPFRMDSLLLGVLLAKVVADHPRSIHSTTAKRVGMAILVPLAAFFPWFLFHTHSLGCLTETYFALLFAAAILFCIQNKGATTLAFLRSPFLRFFGLISYGLYLFHDACLSIARCLLLGGSASLFTTMLATGLALIISILVAAILRFTVERHFLNLGARQKYHNQS